MSCSHSLNTHSSDALIIHHKVSCKQYGLNSSPSAAYMRQWTMPPLVQVMACRLFGANPLPGPVLAYCQLDSWKQIADEIWIGIR